jgi:hypothetical protein
MYDLSRRKMLKSLLGATSVLAANPTKALRASPPTTMGTLNLHFRGPFAFIFFQSLKKILVLAPSAPFHHLPEIFWENGEMPIQRQDYELCGFSSPMSAVNDPPRPYPVANPGPSRLNVPAASLHLDQSGVGSQIDVDGRRFFSLRVPVPDLIVPGHLTGVLLKGNQAPKPSPSGKDWYPVGHTFIYTNVPLSAVAVAKSGCIGSCAPNGTTACPLGLTPFPNQTHTDLYVQMDPSEDEDPNHSFAAAAFGTMRELFRNVKLDVWLCYDSACALATSAANQQSLQSEAVQHRVTSDVIPFTHTGADCHSPVIELTGTADDLSLGQLT